VQSDIGSRRAGRRRAFQVLYGLCFAPVASDEDLAKFFDNAPLPKGKEPSAGASDFAWELTAGVWDHKGDLDEVVSRFSTHWKVGRIAKIELTILRLAVYEMLHAEETPAKVAINEAVELAKSYGDDNSKNFVNGILDAVAKAIDNDTIRLHQ
jgi:N utilization substance protein B